jgi:putative endonuclease
MPFKMIANVDLSAPDFEPETRVLGRRGEELAAKFLEREDFRLVCANFSAPVGRNRRGAIVTAEIDLIAYEADILCFVEVKTRRTADFAAPEANVDLRKQRQIIRAARVYRQMFGLQNAAFRYDVISIVLAENKRKTIIKLLRGFWTETKFRKMRWAQNRQTASLY